MTRFDRTPQKSKRAKELRNNLTDAERKLWRALKGKQLEGLKFRRQHPVGRYILDFYCPAVRLCVEVDGGQHNEPENIKRDQTRSDWLAARGISVVRVWNFEVFESLEGVIETILDHVRVARNDIEMGRDDIPSP